MNVTITTETGTINLADLTNLDEAIRVLCLHLPAGLFADHVKRLEDVEGAAHPPVPLLEVSTLGPDSDGMGEMWCYTDNLYIGRDGRCYRASGQGKWRNYSNNRGGADRRESMTISWRTIAVTPEEFEDVITKVEEELSQWRERSERARRIADGILAVLGDKE